MRALARSAMLVPNRVFRESRRVLVHNELWMLDAASLIHRDGNNLRLD